MAGVMIMMMLMMMIVEAAGYLKMSVHLSYYTVQIPDDIYPLRSELNASAQRCLPRFLLGILIFKGLTARRLYK
jgi:hypothetical protein